ncbi:Uncharacterized protein APZ42_026511 [Daphnia magna]|uniref:Uncharacterized protein n=1 Tax=Daphnia magna TaxID=35525 RepID=A0A162DB55_9CRUS|nr:Uncharacterized protein APZ42_026511 [Daphnia magna]
MCGFIDMTTFCPSLRKCENLGNWLQRSADKLTLDGINCWPDDDCVKTRYRLRIKAKIKATLQ